MPLCSQIYAPFEFSKNLVYVEVSKIDSSDVYRIKSQGNWNCVSIGAAGLSLDKNIRHFHVLVNIPTHWLLRLQIQGTNSGTNYGLI